MHNLQSLFDQRSNRMTAYVIGSCRQAMMSVAAGADAAIDTPPRFSVGGHLRLRSEGGSSWAEAFASCPKLIRQISALLAREW
jgi:hypothetical protein